MDGLHKTILPRTLWGKEIGEWGKLLFGVTSTDDFDGEYSDRGTASFVRDGDLYLECAGYRTKSDDDARKDRLFVLHQFRFGTWQEILRTKERAWKEIILPEVKMRFD